MTFYAAEQLCDGNNTFSDGNATVTAKVENGKVRLDVGGVIKKNQNIRYTSAVLSSIGEAAQRLDSACGKSGRSHRFPFDGAL